MLDKISCMSHDVLSEGPLFFPLRLLEVRAVIRDMPMTLYLQSFAVETYTIVSVSSSPTKGSRCFLMEET